MTFSLPNPLELLKIRASVWLFLALTAVFLLFLYSQETLVIWAMFALLIFSFYTAVLWMLFQLESQKTFSQVQQPIASWPSLAILMPNYNDGETVVQAIENARRLTYPLPFEIIVLDDYSTDGSPEKLKKLQGLSNVRIILKEKNEGKAKALNDGLALTNAEVIVGLDADTFPSPDALLQMVPKLYEDSSHALVLSKIFTTPPKTFLQKIIEIEFLFFNAFFAQSLSKLNLLWLATGQMIVFKRDIVLKVGGFDNGNMIEDMEIALRLRDRNYKVVFSDNPIALTETPKNLFQFFRQRQRWYRGFWYNARKYKHMFFNPSMGEFGFLMFPFVSFLQFIASLSFIVLVSHFAFNIFFSHAYRLYFMRADLVAYILNGPQHFFITPVELFYFSLLLLLLAMVVYSYSAIDKKLSLRQLPLIGIYLILYPFLIMAVHWVSLLKELNRSKYVW